MNRLSPALLVSLPAAVARPSYAREVLLPRIVHLGIGAFARAHLASVNDISIEQGSAERWSIAGVSLRSGDTRNALRPQAGLYTLALRDAPNRNPREQLRVIGNLTELMVAPEDPAAVLRRIAAEATAIVSLTVTEKGYCRNPASGALLHDHPDIAHDVLHAEAPRSAIGFVVRGLQMRRESGLGPLALMSLDNLPSNGDLLRSLTVDFAAQIDEALAAWIERECSFPNAMVDRIVPRTTAADREAISKSLGCTDAWPVVSEPALEWAVEDRFVAGRPDWHLGGARFVESAAPFERAKLRVVNACHSALAYLAASAGVATVDAALSMPGMRSYLRRLVDEEIGPGLGPIPGVDIGDFRDRMLARFDNPALAHQTHQIAMDGSQKLPQRLLGSLRERLARKQSVELLALAVAAWFRYLDGVDDLGCAYPVRDPLCASLTERAKRARTLVEAEPDQAAAERLRARELLSCAAVFGDLGDSAALAEQVAVHGLSFRSRGVAGTLEQLGVAGGGEPCTGTAST